MNSELNPIEKINNWVKNSVSLKIITIGILILILLIPASMIESIIHEREKLNQSAIREVSQKWADKQQITGPVLTVPLVFWVKEKDQLKEVIDYQHFLPEALNIGGSVSPESLRRGIYEVVVYKSKLKFEGTFLLNEPIEHNQLKEIQWHKAFLTLGITDLRGIEDQVVLDWNGAPLKVKPGSRIADIVYSGVTIDLPGFSADSTQPYRFSFDLNLQGSQELEFVPVGSETNVTLTSAWKSPSFNGNFLPDERQVSEEGFSASWKVLQLNRNFPQTWLQSAYTASFKNHGFGLELLLPLDDYQKSMRSAKYAIMTIALTFLIFFLVEVLNGRKIHPFQYTLVGLALCLFYVLLVSISEHSSFNTAYFISATVVVGMIGLYSTSVFKANKLSLLLLACLISIYGFLFVTLQLADYALLMGSIGLALILGMTMYFTRNINWYKLNVTHD